MARRLGHLAALLLALACTYDYDGATRCNNGVKDGDESAIDCGGRCAPCADAATDGGGQKLIHRWENLGLSLQPPKRSCHVLAAGPGNAELLLFSGYFAGMPAQNDTWTFDGASWTKRSPAGALPDERRFAMAAHDEKQGVTVLAGGWRNSTPLSDAWAWDGSAWTALPPLPGGRFGGGMVWDDGSQKLIAVSSVGGAIELLELDFKSTGPEWVYLSTSGAAPPGDTQYLEVAFDRKRGVTVLFVRGQTWALDRSTKSWSHETSDGPGNRRGSALAYDQQRERVVLFGGREDALDGTQTVRDDTWEYDGIAWQQVAPEGKPPARWEGKLTYDAPRRRLVLLGGGNGVSNPPPPFDQAAATWVYYTLGQPCASGAECGNGNCTDGVCCKYTTCPGGMRCDTASLPGDCASGP